MNQLTKQTLIINMVENNRFAFTLWPTKYHVWQVKFVIIIIIKYDYLYKWLHCRRKEPKKDSQKYCCHCFMFVEETWWTGALTYVSASILIQHLVCLQAQKAALCTSAGWVYCSSPVHFHVLQFKSQLFIYHNSFSPPSKHISVTILGLFKLAWKHKWLGTYVKYLAQM